VQVGWNADVDGKKKLVMMETKYSLTIANIPHEHRSRSGHEARQNAEVHRVAWKKEHPEGSTKPTVHGHNAIEQTAPHPDQVLTTPHASNKMLEGGASSHAPATGMRRRPIRDRHDYDKSTGTWLEAQQTDFSGLKIAEAVGAASRVFAC